MRFFFPISAAVAVLSSALPSTGLTAPANVARPVASSTPLVSADATGAPALPADATARAAAEASATSTAPDSASDDTSSASYYVDPIRGRVPFQPEYDLRFGDERRPVRYGRASLELLGVLAIGTGYYWINSNPNKQDWDYLDPADRAAHLDVKFDNNMFFTNFLLHPFAGTMSYWLSRSNGIDVYMSSLNSMLSSAFFEFMLEYLEKPSLNDLVATPVGGIAGGEFLFHLGDYLNSALPRASTAQQVLAYTLGSPEAMHQAFDGSQVAPGTRDTLGYSAEYWHKFSVGYARADITNNGGAHGAVHDLLFDAELVSIPGFQSPGHFGVHFHSGNFTAARLRTSVASSLLQDVDLRIGADLVGHYQQDYDGTEGALQGVATMYAASVYMRYIDRWLLGRRDQLALFHFLGPSGKLWFAPAKGVRASVEGDLHLDFAGISSPSYLQYLRDHGPEGTKTVLQLQNYYSGIGGSGRLAGSLAVAGFELAGHAGYGTYRSIDGFDRYYTPRDALNTDQIIELGLGMTYSPPASPLSLRAGWRSLEHRSQMTDVSVSWRDSRLDLGGAVAF